LLCLEILIWWLVSAESWEFLREMYVTCNDVVNDFN
jgi:hypothetical protein